MSFRVRDFGDESRIFFLKRRYTYTKRHGITPRNTVSGVQENGIISENFRVAVENLKIIIPLSFPLQP